MSTDLIQPLLRFLVLGTVQTEREPNSRSASLGLEQNNRSHTHHLDLRPTLINRASDCNNSQKIYNSNNSHKSQEISYLFMIKGNQNQTKNLHLSQKVKLQIRTKEQKRGENKNTEGKN
jgi:hypothetical protein